MTTLQCSRCGNDTEGTIYQVRQGTSSEGFSAETSTLCVLCLCVYVQEVSRIEVPIIKILHTQRLSSVSDIEVARQAVRQLQQLLGDKSTPELSPEEIKEVRELLQAPRNLCDHKYKSIHNMRSVYDKDGHYIGLASYVCERCGFAI